MQNKVVFTQDELPSILPAPAQEDLPAMGVLQRVQWFSISSKSMSYNFIHLSIQELLAAYCISKMVESEQMRVFQTLLGEPRFSAVLQFYAGFTKLTNQGVRNIITGTDFTDDMSSKHSLLSYMRCFFEAQVCDQSFYQQIVPKLNGKVNLSFVAMSPIDCMAFGNFLVFVLRNTSELRVNLPDCSIDDHSLCVLIEELSKHAEASREGVLHGVTELDISGNKIGDKGIAYIATALHTNTTMRTLDVFSCHISNMGAESLARALAVNTSLQKLNMGGNNIGYNGICELATIFYTLQTNTTLKELIFFCCSNWMTDQEVLLLSSAIRHCSMERLVLGWSCTYPGNTLKEIGESVRRSKLGKLVLACSLHAQVKPDIKKAREWAECLEIGVKDLIQSQENSLLQTLKLYIDRNDSNIKPLLEQVQQTLKITLATVNAARQQKGLPHITFNIHVQLIQ